MTTSKTGVVYPLSFPKGTKHLCELCQKPAHKICEKCRVTYYWYFEFCRLYKHEIKSLFGKKILNKFIAM